MPLGFDQIQSAVAFLADRLGGLPPTVGVVLGSGLGGFADQLEGAVRVPYATIPHFPVSTVEGHRGQMVAGSVNGRAVLCMQGRVHGYEGYDPTGVVFPARVLIRAGVRTMVLTNAAGGIHEDWQPGDLMVITDHINLTGRSPLTGPNDVRLGPRFPDMSHVYPAELQEVAHRAAKGMGLTLRSGVYLGLNGPQYETPAEIRMARTLGADAVGMSTVHEAIACSHLGVPVLGISCITNLAAGISKVALSHTEVKDVANAVESRFVGLLRDICPALPQR
ncbi:MAG: purine-nucleoside phosphorylase [Deltaproteobacteria bacterium]|nr:purine-nucleoside phosphorylase [Deltaproteobacteria bacterium]